MHVAGHSTGAVVALQLALDQPHSVQSLMLLEPFLLSLPAGRAFVAGAARVLELYASGDHEQALAAFLSAVSGLEWSSCEAVLADRVPGAFQTGVDNIDSVFGAELQAMTAWTFGAKQAAAIHQPVLSVKGSKTHPMFVEIADFLSSSLPHVEGCTIDGAGHLLHIEHPEPVARAATDFLTRHPIADYRSQALSVPSQR